MTVTITVQIEENTDPVASWKSGGVADYTVPHDHSPLSNEVQVLLDGEYTDPDNLDNNIGPLGNTGIETTASAQRRGIGVQEQLNWQGTELEKDPTAWAMFRGRPNGATATTNRFGIARDDAVANTEDSVKYSTVYHPYDNMEKHGNDKVTFLWSCPTCKGGGCTYDILKPTVTLPGPEWTLDSSGVWADPGYQTGQTSAGTQWDNGGDSGSITHTCTLTVTDSYGKAHTHTQNIIVRREPNTIPVADAGSDQTYTIPHDFYPSAETNTVLVTLYGAATADADNDKMKHKWQCVIGGTTTALASVELPFPVQLGGVVTGFTYNAEGGIDTGAADPQYTSSSSVAQTSTGWGADSGHSGDGDWFKGTHTHDTNQATVTLGAGTHTCTLTTTDTYNEASSDSITVTVNAEPNTNPAADGGARL